MVVGVVSARCTVRDWGGYRLFQRSAIPNACSGRKLCSDSLSTAISPYNNQLQRERQNFSIKQLSYSDRSGVVCHYEGAE